MATERWTEAMLDTLAQTVSIQAREITNLSGVVQTVSDNLATLAGTVSIQAGEVTNLSGIVQNVSDNLALLIEEQRRDRQEFRDRMDAMQADIRGLQTENRRILERLERHMSDGHGG